MRLRRMFVVDFDSSIPSGAAERLKAHIEDSIVSLVRYYADEPQELFDVTVAGNIVPIYDELESAIRTVVHDGFGFDKEADHRVLAAAIGALPGLLEESARSSTEKMLRDIIGRNSGKKIQAIKELRTAASMGLKEAKDMIDAHWSEYGGDKII